MRKTSYVVTFFVTLVILVLVSHRVKRKALRVNHLIPQNVLSAERPDWLASKPSLPDAQSNIFLH
jgi:hypothetical protein